MILTADVVDLDTIYPPTDVRFQWGTPTGGRVVAE